MPAALVFQGWMVVVPAEVVGDGAARVEAARRRRIDRLPDATLDIDRLPAQTWVGTGTADSSALV